MRTGRIVARIRACPFRNRRMIALGDLIQAKETLGREKDLLAAKELRAIAARRSAENA